MAVFKSTVAEFWEAIDKLEFTDFYKYVGKEMKDNGDLPTHLAHLDPANPVSVSKFKKAIKALDITVNDLDVQPAKYKNKMDDWFDDVGLSNLFR